MGAVGCRGTGARKNNRKRSTNGRVALILRCMSGKKKPGTWQGWLRWPYRILSGMSAKKGVRVNCLCLLQKVRRENLGSNAKKTQKPANSNWCKPNKISQKKQAYKMSPKRKKKKAAIPQNELRCSALWPFEVRSTKRTKCQLRLAENRDRNTDKTCNNQQKCKYDQFVKKNN